MSNAKVLERCAVNLAAEPADINGGATTGDYFDLSKFERVLVVLAMGDGTAGNDVDIKVYQAQDNAGTGAKVLNALQTGRIYTRYAADLATHLAQTAWTKVTQATADEAYEPTDNGEAVGSICLELRAGDLDVQNDFTHIRADLTNPGASKICALLYIGIDARDAYAPELMSVAT
jgi:hypothetical protein